MGKKAVIFIVVVTVIALIAGWFLLQSVMTNYNIDEDASQPHHSELEHMISSQII